MAEGTFKQATIPVADPERFEALGAAVERVFAPAEVERFLKAVDKSGLRIRQFECVLEKALLERVDAPLRSSGQSARDLFRGMPLSDQGQIRELYLVRLEAVDPQLRFKYRKIYKYD